MQITPVTENVCETSTQNLSKGEQTKQHIVATAAQLFHQQGYHNTGLQQILNTAEVTKGAFYFHFKDKKSLAIAVIQFFGQFFKQAFAAGFTDDSLTATEKLASFHYATRGAFAGDLGMVGCPIGNLTLELAAIDAELQQHFSQAFKVMSQCFVPVIEQGQASGAFNQAYSAQQLADFFISSWEGALLRMKADQSMAALDAWFELIMASIKAK